MEATDPDAAEKRRKQVREASRRLRKRKRDEMTALRAEASSLRSLVDTLRVELSKVLSPTTGAPWAPSG